MVDEFVKKVRPGQTNKSIKGSIEDMERKRKSVSCRKFGI